MEIWTPTNKRDSKKHWKKKGEQRKKKPRRRKNLQPWKEPLWFNSDSLEWSWVAPMRPAKPVINLATGQMIQVIKFHLFFYYSWNWDLKFFRMPHARTKHGHEASPQCKPDCCRSSRSRPRSQMKRMPNDWMFNFSYLFPANWFFFLVFSNPLSRWFFPDISKWTKWGKN